MKEFMECPYGEGEAVLTKAPQIITYRKEEFKVIAHFYTCKECNEEFTTNETDHITLLQAHNQYREKHGIPFPEEIKAIREQYQLSAAKMSEALRLGENGYGNYEKGEMPTPAIGSLIKTATKPANFIDLLLSHKHLEDDKALMKAKTLAENLSKEKKPSTFFELLNNYHDPNNYTGYVALNTSKIEGLLVHFIQKCDHEYNDRLKLSKLLFFTDFWHYRNFGRSVSGLAYQIVKAGPVPIWYDHFFTYFEHRHIIYPEWQEIWGGRVREIVKTHKHSFKDDIFNDQEKGTIDSITELYKNTATWALVEKSTGLNIKVEMDSKDHLVGFQENAFAMVGV
jgi:putative zinc finger/helix-turn-helix YgiT family protein